MLSQLRLGPPDLNAIDMFIQNHMPLIKSKAEVEFQHGSRLFASICITAVV